MIQKTLLFVILIIGVTNAISITISSARDRCMIVSTTNDEEYLKLDLKFNSMIEHQKNQGYKITLQNTQTGELQNFQTFGGVYRKEIKLTEHVVYHLCLRIALVSDVEITSIMEYNAGIKHRQIFQTGNITIPKSLLRVDDLKHTYSALHKIEQLTKEIKNGTEQKLKIDNADFQLMQQKMETLQTISIIELGVIVLFSIVQFVRLASILENRAK